MPARDLDEPPDQPALERVDDAPARGAEDAGHGGSSAAHAWGTSSRGLLKGLRERRLLTLQRAAYVTESQRYDDPRLPPLKQTLNELRAELADPAVVALGVRDRGWLVAAVRLRDRGGGRVALGRLVVVPDRQGEGFGTRLLRASQTAVPGTVAIELFTGERSEGNLRLYAREGYVETYRSSAGGYELVHLVKSLDPAW